MTTEDYTQMAVNKVIGFMREQGLKYRRADFFDNDVQNNRVVPISNGGGFLVTCLFSFERCGKQLKLKRNNFLNYANARVLAKGIAFVFSVRELEIEELSTESVEDGEKIGAVIQKIQKLLALSDTEKNPNEHEALAASMMVQKLLAKHKIEMVQVVGEKKEEEITRVVSDAGAGKKWKYALADAVADSYCCKLFCQGDAVGFYGFKSDCLIARRVFVYLFEVGHRLANAFVRQYREIGANTSGIYNSFCLGFATGVKKELSYNCKALALVVSTEVETSFNDFSKTFSEAKQSTKKVMVDEKAFEEGRVEGKRALNSQYIGGDDSNVKVF